MALNSVIYEMAGAIKRLALMIRDLNKRLKEVELRLVAHDCSLYRWQEHQVSGQQTYLAWKRPDGTTAMTSQLSGLRSDWGVTLSDGQYTQRVETLYAKNGVNVVRTIVYNLSYDANGAIVTEVVASVTNN